MILSSRWIGYPNKSLQMPKIQDIFSSHSSWRWDFVIIFCLSLHLVELRFDSHSQVYERNWNISLKWLAKMVTLSVNIIFSRIAFLPKQNNWCKSSETLHIESPWCLVFQPYIVASRVQTAYRPQKPYL